MKNNVMPKVILDTNFGEITITLFPDLAPKTVENFVKLSKNGFYDGILFHRVIPQFVIQGGDPNTKNGQNKNSWGLGGPGYCIPAEFNSTSHTRGIVSMARSRDPDSAGSQFFIVLKDAKRLDGQYTAFGKVTEGMRVADEISNISRDLQDRPSSDAKILTVRIS